MHFAFYVLLPYSPFAHISTVCKNTFFLHTLFVRMRAFTHSVLPFIFLYFLFFSFFFCFYFFFHFFAIKFQITNVSLHFGVAWSHNCLGKKLTKIVRKRFETDTQQWKIIKQKQWTKNRNQIHLHSLFNFYHRACVLVHNQCPLWQHFGGVSAQPFL